MKSIERIIESFDKIVNKPYPAFPKTVLKYSYEYKVNWIFSDIIGSYNSMVNSLTRSFLVEDILANLIHRIYGLGSRILVDSSEYTSTRDNNLKIYSIWCKCVNHIFEIDDTLKNSAYFEFTMDYSNLYFLYISRSSNKNLARIGELMLEAFSITENLDKPKSQVQELAIQKLIKDIESQKWWAGKCRIAMNELVDHLKYLCNDKGEDVIYAIGVTNLMWITAITSKVYIVQPMPRKVFDCDIRNLFIYQLIELFHSDKRVLDFLAKHHSKAVARFEKVSQRIYDSKIIIKY